MKIKGNIFPKEKFKVIEEEVPNIEIIDMMLKAEGEFNVPVYIIRNFNTKEDCEKIKNQFYKIIAKTSGGNRVEEFVKVFQIGSTQFQKTTDEYFNECENSKPNIDLLLSVLKSDKAQKDFMLEQTLQEYFSSKKISFEPSSYKDRCCNLFTARQWNNDKELSLLAHEDLSQLALAKLDEYEIGNVKNVIASNLCVENSYDAKLILWNMAPDFETRKNLRLENSGYPYPTDILEDIEYLTLQTNPGDLYFINANYIHAVSKQRKNKRISLGRFMGYTSANTINYWT